MSTMIWKEWRENLKWAVLAMLALGLAEYYGLNAENFDRAIGRYDYSLHADETLTKPAFLMVTTFGSAAVGLLLALVQFLSERRRDQWAALLHRPVARATIFRGKVAAGLALYLLATIPPFLASVWYVATPGHFVSPFVPGMALAGVADLIGGAMWYAAGILVSVQRGKWFGLRGLLLLGVLFVSCVATSTRLFRVAVEAEAVMAAVLLVAACGAMTNNGPFRPRSLAARVTLLAVAFYGVCQLGALLGLVHQVSRGNGPYPGKEYGVGEEGVPLILEQRRDYSFHVTDLEGNAVTDPRYIGDQRYNHVQNFSTVATGGETWRWWKNVAYRYSRGYAMLLTGYGDAAPEKWFYLVDRQAIVGYSAASRRPFGSFGEGGFQKGAPIAPGFVGEMADYSGGEPAVFRFGGNVYGLDFNGRRTGAIFRGDEKTILGSEMFSVPGENKVRLVALAFRDGIHLMVPDGAALTSLRYTHDIDRWGHLDLAINRQGDRYYLMYGPSSRLPAAERAGMPSYVDELDAAGNVVRSHVLSPEPEPKEPWTVARVLGEGLRVPAVYFGQVAYEAAGRALGSRRLGDILRARFTVGRAQNVEDIVFFSLFSSLAAVAAFVLARRAQFRSGEVGRWTLFCLLFNVAGLIIFRLAADWPVLAKCPACGKLRRVDDAACPHCSAAWPVPERDGTEIFDGAARPDEALSR